MYSYVHVPRAVPSIRISSVSKNISLDHIERTFEHLGSIIVIETIDCGSHNQAVVHFQHWYNNEDANFVRSVLLKSEELLVMYKLNQYWSTFATNTLDDEQAYPVDRNPKKTKKEMDEMMYSLEHLSLNDSLPNVKNMPLPKRMVPQGLPIAQGLSIIAQGLPVIKDLSVVKDLPVVKDVPVVKELPSCHEIQKQRELDDAIKRENWFEGPGRINGNLNYGPYVSPPKKRKITII